MGTPEEQAVSWLLYAKNEVDRTFPDYSEDQKAALIAAMIQASVMERISFMLHKVSESLSSAHTESVSSSLREIASSLNGIAFSLDDKIPSPPKIPSR